MHRLAKVDEVSPILYSVGVLMPGIDPALTKLADSLDFPLICMPKNRLDLRYSEVICEVMETSFRDQSKTSDWSPRSLTTPPACPITSARWTRCSAWRATG